MHVKTLGECPGNLMQTLFRLTRAHALALENIFSRQRPDEYQLGNQANHDTVEELGSLVQQAQQRAGTKSKRGSGNYAESRTNCSQTQRRNSSETNCRRCCILKGLFRTAASSLGQESAPRYNQQHHLVSCFRSNQRQDKPEHHFCR